MASTDVQDRKRTKPDVGTANCAVRVDDPTAEYEVPKVARCSAAPSPGKVDAPSAPSGEPGKENLPLAVEARSTSAAPVKFATTVINHLSRPVHIPKPREIVPYRIKIPDDATVNAVAPGPVRVTFVGSHSTSANVENTVSKEMYPQK